MNDQVTITLTKKQAVKLTAKLKRIEDVILNRMDRVQFLAHVAEQQADHMEEFPPYAWSGLSASLRTLNRDAAKEHRLISSLIDKLTGEVTA